MAISRLRGNAGFTLIEIVIIIVVLGILAAVAIPKYQDITGEAREASCRASLGGLRSGITIFYANQAVTTGTATWPLLAELQTPGVVMAQGLPPNPYATSADSAAIVVAGATKGVPVASAAGWAYLPATGEIWANTATDSSCTW
ncbi:MAG: prepilin-type N-terminal cleavage/methylation domain-containing protein [candidate division Zixibacteria bacterium]|nr:prepilin-type N-terminal cleavage/methylation domain-containing protein [candidate division Zixibacteria bacterium]